MPSQPLTTVNWIISTTVSATDYNLVPMPITSDFLESLKGSEWASQAHPALKRCNSFTFAKRGFSSSIGYLAFDANTIVGSTTIGAVIKAMLDNRTTVRLTQQYINEAGAISEYYAYQLYAHEAEVFHSQNGGMSVVVLKLVDNRYYAPILAPIRNSTHSFTTYSSDARAVDLFYTGFNGPDWESSSPAEYPTIYEQLCYWLPAFKGWAVTIPNTSPLTGAGISVSPQSETAYGCFRRLIEHCYSTTFCDLQINSADGDATVVTNVPAPSDIAAYGDSSVSCGYYKYKADISTTKYEVLFPLNRKSVWNTETVNSSFRLRFLSPYMQQTRAPSAAYLAYYPDGVPSSTDECISIISNDDVVPDRESSKASGPVGASISVADKYDFDYTTLATVGDAVVAKYIANSKAFSGFQAKTLLGFADPYTYGSVPNLICGARFLLQDVPTTELFWGVRFQVRETEGLPYCGPAEQLDAQSPINANLHLRQLGEQAFEELEQPYSSWSGHSEFKLYGHATYSGGAYNPVSSTTCDVIYGIGEAKLSHIRLDENTSETDSLAAGESHVLVKSRGMVVSESFVCYQTNDGVYRPTTNPSLRVAAVQTRWNTAVSPAAATASTDMHQKFLSPYFGESIATTGNITAATNVLAFDRHSFRVFEKTGADNYTKSEFATTFSDNPVMAFITDANRVCLGKTAGAISDGGSGTVNLYTNTSTQVTYGPSSTAVTVSATSLFGAVSSGKWVIMVEISEAWYIINADC